MKAFIMTSMFLLSALLVVNVIGWMWPFLTHPIVFTVWFGFLLIFVWKIAVRDNK
jgi:hypothetical protein